VILLEFVGAKEAEQLYADAFERIRWGVALGRIQNRSTNIVVVYVWVCELALDGDQGWLNWVAVWEKDGEMERSVAFWRQDQARLCEVAISEVKGDAWIWFGL
jgi:hypothetical protein